MVLQALLVISLILTSGIGGYFLGIQLDKNKEKKRFIEFTCGSSIMVELDDVPVCGLFGAADSDAITKIRSFKSPDEACALNPKPKILYNARCDQIKNKIQLPSLDAKKFENPPAVVPPKRPAEWDNEPEPVAMAPVLAGPATEEQGIAE